VSLRAESSSMSDLPVARERRLSWLVAATLFLVTVGVYLPCADFGFLSYDDNESVTENALVRRGLDLPGVAAAFSRTGQGNWIPLSVISHMLDVTLFGLEPAGHHLVNVLIHALNAALLLVLLRALTGRLWPSAFCAAVFALHPLAVESVAWVEERKNVLSTLLGLCCIFAYAFYVRQPSLRRYLWVAALMALSLLAKPMLVTMPFLLLLMDYWPLERWRPRAGESVAASSADLRSAWSKLALEKLPLCALSLGSGLVALLAQSHIGAMAKLGLPLSARLVTASLGSLRYLYALIWPADLSLLYPHPYFPATGGVAPTGSEVTAVVALLVGISLLVLLSRRGYLIFGWLFYLLSLAPVSGVIQVGLQGFADRYSYVPLIGIYVAMAWGGAEILRRLGEAGARRLARGVFAVGAVCWLGLLASLTHAQEQHWRSSIALYSRGVQVSPRHAYLRLYLAQELQRAHRYEPAIDQYVATVQLMPEWAFARGELARLLLQSGRAELGLEQYRIAIARDPRNQGFRLGLANALAQTGHLEEAISAYEQIAAGRPASAVALFNWANALAMRGDLAGAIAKLREALAREPDYAPARQALERALVLERQTAQAKP
jgi:tetratricopeptide (TPR) repeat protein